MASLDFFNMEGLLFEAGQIVGRFGGAGTDTRCGYNPSAMCEN